MAGDPSSPAYAPPNLVKMREALERMDAEGFRRMVDAYLDALGEHVTAETLRLFRLDLMQLVYALLQSHNLEARRLFASAESDRFFAGATHSLEDMSAYAGYLAWVLVNAVRLNEQPATLIDTVREYIDAHLEQDLTRAHLSRIVYLNPDYLARLFKKELGVSLGQYIKDRRMEKSLPCAGGNAHGSEPHRRHGRLRQLFLFHQALSRAVRHDARGIPQGARHAAIADALKMPEEPAVARRFPRHPFCTISSARF